jgi:hypothetical protein
MAQAPDYAKAYNSGVANALMIAQTRKTNAEATIVEDHQNQAKLESELYGSGVGIWFWRSYRCWCHGSGS